MDGRLEDKIGCKMRYLESKFLANPYSELPMR